MPPRRRPFIPGLHFYCDHRCWRCALASRCLVHEALERQERREPPDPRERPVRRVARVVMLSLAVTCDLAQAAARRRPHPTARASSLGTVLGTEPESSRDDPLVLRTAEYAQTSLRIVQALRPALARRRDAAADEAADRIEEAAVTIASKVYRAIASTGDEGADPAGSAGDAAGSAKVALLLIRESRDAWAVLGAAGRGLANGTPARFAAILRELESGVLARFPRAMDFVRPGFDDGGEARPGRGRRS